MRINPVGWVESSGAQPSARILGAIEQFHQNGYARTCHLDVAKAADLSAGNVFFYFQAKDDLAKK